MVNKVKEARKMPDVTIDDDMIETIFGEDRLFSDAYRLEIDLYYEAVNEPDLEKKRSLVTEALQLTRRRQGQFFQGDYVSFSALEEIFLNMEGVATWAAYQAAPSKSIDRAGNTWSQDFGLALYLLIDQLVPNWQTRALGSELASPFSMLEVVVEEPPN